MIEQAERVVVGMSGGVDSSVTASLLKQEGRQVEGVSFILYDAGTQDGLSGCCSLSAIDDAKRTAHHLGIPHRVLDLRDAFKKKVIEPFIDAYARGFTPNPCILCNRYIKFPHLLKIAEERGDAFIATGHYAGIDRRPDREEVFLAKGIDSRKDQSYVLAMLSRQCINRLMLPLGGMRKDQVRRIAQELSLPSATRSESQEICFVENDYTAFLEGAAGDSAGPVIHAATGEVLGRHGGLHLFTIGQRKRLGVSSPVPLYVVRLDPLQKAVYVGPREMVMKREFVVEEMNWLVAEREFPLKTFRAMVKMRSTMPEEPADIALCSDNRVRVSYDQPQWAPAPGQAAVLYDGDRVIGGGMIVGE